MFHFNLSSSVFALVLLGTLLSLCTAQGNPNYGLYDDDADDYDEPAVHSRTHANSAPSSSIPIATVYRPYPQRPAPAPQDPNVIFVPRLGSVRGQVGFKTINNRAVNAFLGLQYGTVQPGLGRFQRALVPEHNSNEIIDATREPKACPQFPKLQDSIEDDAQGITFPDCLYLNIYAPNKTGLFPVLVFVHGEMLFDGSAEEGQPDYFLEQDVVLVSVSYRLAPFGFLTTLSNEMPGNVALADLQMALEWIQQHIRPFGGNAGQVTLLGQAGGATLVHALSLSGKAQGLFHNIILQSGTAINPYFLDEEPSRALRNIASQARCPLAAAGRVQSLVSCFERLRTSEILRAFKLHWEENESRGLMFTGGFKLVVGDKLGYLSKQPAALVAENKYPLIAGVTKDAGAFIMSRFYNQLQAVRSRNITDFINVVLKHTTQPRFYNLWQNWALRHIFTDDDARYPTLQALAQGLLELTNLILYRAPLIDSIRYTSRQYPTYLYCFDYRGEFHRFGHLRNPLPFEADATLSDDNIYLFPYPEEVAQLNNEDKTIALALTTMWVNFATYNVPNFNASIWPNVSSEYGPFVRISNSRTNALELDYHFGEGIPVPNIYPEYFTTTTTTTTRRPYPNHPNYSNYQQRTQAPPPYLSHEHVLDDPRMSSNQNYPNYPSQNEHANMNGHYGNNRVA